MSSYAIIRTGGKQYLAVPGQTITVEKLLVEAGQPVTFDDVLFIGGDDVRIGTPTVSGAKVIGTVTRQYRTQKVSAVKFHNKVRYRRTFGHRQYQTAVKIDKIA